MELVRKYLTADEIGTPAIRWNSDCDCVQQSPDGGTTWVDVPTADPRSAAGFAMPPAASDNPQCDGAERMIAALKRLIDIVVQSAGSVAAVSAVLGYLADFLFGIGTLVALVLEAVTGLLALGQELLDAAFTSDVYDQIKCLAFDHLGSDGHFDDTGWAGFQSAVLAAFGGTVNIAMGIIFQLEGINGFNNAASVGTETGDCAACETWCYTFDFLSSDGGWAVPDFLAGYGHWESGTGWVADFDGTSTSAVDAAISFASTVVTKVTIEYNMVAGVQTCPGEAVVGIWGGVFSPQLIRDNAPYLGASPETWEGSETLTGLIFQLQPSCVIAGGVGGGSAAMTRITVHGTGTNPFGSDNC